MKDKYVYDVIEGIAPYINTRLSDAIDEGWEIAGQASVHYHGTPTNNAFLYIPIRKKIE